MSNAQSRLLPTTPGFELSDTQFDYFRRRKDRNVGFPGSECYQSCHKTPGKCDNYCAEEGFWTGSCCKFGASGDQQAEVCEGRGCIGFHCCVADVLTSEEDQDKWSKRAGKKDKKDSTGEKHQQEEDKEQEQEQEQEQQEQQEQEQEKERQQQEQEQQEHEQAQQQQQQQQQQDGEKGLDDEISSAPVAVAPVPVAVQAPAPEAVAVAPTPVPLPEDRPKPEQASELGPMQAESAGLPANTDAPGNAEDRQHEMEEAQREAEAAQKRGQEETAEEQAAVKALKPPENDALDAAIASASSAAESQQRKLEDAQMEAEEKQREAQQEYEKEQARSNAAADAEREAKNEAMKEALDDAAAQAAASVNDAYHDAEAQVSAAGGGPEAAAKAEAEAKEDPFGDAKGFNGRHQWINGYSRNSLRDLFLHGTPSNDLKEVGLTVHCFDGTEDYTQPWRPCDRGACKQFAHWWSASIISVKQPATFSTAGIILTPSKTKLLCSYPSDFGSMNAGCKWSNRPHVWQPYDANHTKEMLTSSVDMNSTGNLGAKTLGITMYNEVLVDSKDLMSHMPKSIGAFVFFDDDEYNHNKPYTPLPDKIVATSAYVALLDFYNLTESDIPILQINRTDGSFMDVSRGARRFLELHSFEQYRKRHPYWQDAWRQQKAAQDDAQTPSTMRKQLFEKISGTSAQPEDYEAPPQWDPYAWLEKFSRAHGGGAGDWAL